MIIAINAYVFIHHGRICSGCKKFFFYIILMRITTQNNSPKLDFIKCILLKLSYSSYEGRRSGASLVSCTTELLYFTFSHLADAFIQSDLQIKKSN